MVLGYSNIKNALHTNIQPRDKTAAKELGELVVDAIPPLLWVKPT